MTIDLIQGTSRALNERLAKNLKQVDIDSEILRDFCLRHPIQTLSLFGSILRDDFTDQSDVDFLVELGLNAKVGLLTLSAMENELTDLIGRKADLRTAEELSRYFRQAVVDEAVLVYIKAK